MANERITEDIVREHFKRDALFSSIKFEEQKSGNKLICELLKGCSKSQGKGNGYPEFIMTFPSNSDYLIVVECKFLPSQHESKKRNKPVDFAVDGILHYAKALSKAYTVLALAVSGEAEEELCVSHFLWEKGAKTYEEKTDKNLLSINNYLKLFQNEQFADNLRNINIISKAIELNEDYNNYSIPEQDRNTMVSAILLSLLHEPFRDGYSKYSTAKSLGEAMIKAVEVTLDENGVKNKNAMVGEFSKLLNQPVFNQVEIKNKKEKIPKKSIEVIKEMISYLHLNIYPLLGMEDVGYDILGRFYTEFIRYAGSEQKQGLVLTPSHITDLFCDLTQINVNDVVYDPCCGTAGFLVSAMKRLFCLAGNNSDLKMKIKNEQLIGVEMRPAMYTYASSNMMLRGDGKSNIYCGDCFQTKGAVSVHKPTVSFLNPPYDVGAAQQMKFIEHSLDVVAPQNGRVAAIVQMSCGIKNEKDLISVKKRLLEKHHLQAVLSMPDDLFYPVGVVTCIMIFEANKPNRGKKTWFGYFKNDGFEKRKYQGRIDAKGKFAKIKENWLRSYYNFDEVEGLSVKQEVTAENEWCAEAYMKSYYSNLDDKVFINKMRNHSAFLLSKSNITEDIVFTNKSQIITSQKFDLNTSSWQWFDLKKLFSFERGTRLTKDKREEGDIPLITAGYEREGVAQYISNEEMIKYKNCITIDMFGNSFFRNYTFNCDDNILVLKSKNKILSNYEGIFLSTILNLDNYKYAYGRQCRQKNLSQTQIKLPVSSIGGPDWEFMENFIKSLPYSANL